jgi:shikimate dehydrogenase
MRMRWERLFLIQAFIMISIFSQNIEVKGDSFFSPNLEELRTSTTRTNFILSSYLRKSMTIRLYPHVMSHLEIEGKFLPYELPLKRGFVDRSALAQFLAVFQENSHFETLIVSDPYKQIIVDYVDELTSIARAIGTVNFVYKSHGRLIGDNRDAEAFLLGLTEEIGCKYEGKSMLFFGCGGVSSAIAFKLAPQLKKIGLVEIDKEKKEKLLKILKTHYPTIPVVAFDRDGPLDFSDFDIFYNGTGLGKFSSDPNALTRSPLLEGDIIPKTGLAIDANYTPWETLFLQQMTCFGFDTLNGYSHMVGSTTLHLSYLSGNPIDYSKVRSFANELISEK